MKTPRVYIYCGNEEGNLQEDVITLAEGLRELDVPVHGNCDYWQESTEPGSFLIRYNPAIRPDDCDLVIVSYTWPHWIKSRTFEVVNRPLPADLFKPGRKYVTVYMDHADGHRTVSWEPEFRQFDHVLRAKLNRRAWHPANLRPWVLGLNGRILQATAGGAPFAQRNRSVLINYGASHSYPHGTRNFSARLFEEPLATRFPVDRTRDDLSQPPTDPYDLLMWRQTGGRFSRSYYDRIKASQAVACFCGELIPPAPFANPECYLVGGNKARVRRAFYEALGLLDPRPRRAVQWDSFRFWETLAAGSAAINLDLEHYGVQLPVMPRNFHDYIGVNLAKSAEAIDRILGEPGLLERVAANGHAWALLHYAPVVQARRLLELTGLTPPKPPHA